MNVFLLLQTGSHCPILLEGQKQRERKHQDCEG